MKIFITGAAGLVGQNLILRLKNSGKYDIVAVDKHHVNTDKLKELHPDIEVIKADLANDIGWESKLRGADTLIMLHA
ncbi:MAG TPA: NAD-dependent epimerase/dehydratase family protein, partial [Saprospiraceae bacterium]|nr:NAD-dependent epimerase/dehydratase family protein [Saprospiraceae bacterium]